MRICLALFLFILFVDSFGQQLNKAGHFKVESGKDFIVDDAIKMLFPGQRLIGIKNGYFILPIECTSSPVVIKVTDKSGKLVWSKSFDQLINLSFSPSRSFCAFHDARSIHVINLTDFNTKKFNGSNVFALNDKGEIVFFDEENKAIVISGHRYEIDEMVNKIAFANDRIVFITRKCVFLIDDQKLSPVFCPNGASVFDMQFIDGILYVSIKKKEKDRFVFQSFISSNFKSFKYDDQQVFFLKSSIQKKANHIPLKNQNQFSTGEIIRDPLDFYSDTVYQQVGNSYGEIQYYGSPAYLHPGVDLLGYNLQDVYSVKKGFVKAIITTADTFHWRIAISNVNTADTSIGYLYAHLDQTTIPYIVGDSVNEGDLIGQLVNFPVAGFVHCHFARIFDAGSVWAGDWWTLENPLSSMTNFFDSIPPEFQLTKGNDVFAFRDGNGSYLAPDSLYGLIKVISKVHDRINSNWNVDVNKLRYNLSPLANPQAILLDSFAYEYNFFTDSYLAGSYNVGVMNTIYSLDNVCHSTADYTLREFYHIVTNSDGIDTLDANDSTQFFNTANFPDGSYIFRVIATDPSGNVSMDSMVVQFKNGINTSLAPISTQAIQVYPNPSKDGNFTIRFGNKIGELHYELYNSLGEIIQSEDISPGNDKCDVHLLQQGIYFLQIIGSGEKINKKIVVQ